mmetsp:Transcript_92279/g.214393  ORF Transcript_92279/g.214393 Transcript_92279/m.214393 type:complete len:188 (-) Transcript_92279:104-667(-)
MSRMKWARHHQSDGTLQHAERAPVTFAKVEGLFHEGQQLLQPRRPAGAPCGSGEEAARGERPGGCEGHGDDGRQSGIREQGASKNAEELPGPRLRGGRREHPSRNGPWVDKAVILLVASIRLEDDYQPDCLELTHKMVNPGNPTGVTIPQATLQRISELCAEHKVWLVVDTTHEYFTYEAVKPLQTC